ncbi:MAG TPA: hypothetical protein PLS62_15255 [Desulfobacteraceae bacterium]|nr:hypothetical protein [Desulfobacteraceae bacterium]
MCRQYSKNLFLVLLLFLMAASLSCSTTKHFAQKIIPGGTSELKKRILVLPFSTMAAPEWGTGAQISDDFIMLLEKDSHILIYKPPEEESWLSGKNPELLKKAEYSGINAFVTGILYHIETRIAKKGIWPFRKHRKIYEISMAVNIVDVTTRTMLLSNLESREVPVSLDELQLQKEKELADSILKKAMATILKKQAKAVSKKLLESPFTGKILAVENKSLTINIGKETGLKPGHYFDVFSSGESIKCANGQAINLLGNKIGEIKVSLVMDNHSLALPVNEGPFMPGLIIRFKP